MISVVLFWQVITHLGTTIQHLPSTMLPPLGQKGLGARYQCMLLELNGKLLQEISDLIEQVYLCPCSGFLDLLPFMAGCAPLLMVTGKCLSI